MNNNISNIKKRYTPEICVSFSETTLVYIFWDRKNLNYAYKIVELNQFPFVHGFDSLETAIEAAEIKYEKREKARKERQCEILSNSEIDPQNT